MIKFYSVTLSGRELIEVTYDVYKSNTFTDMFVCGSGESLCFKTPDGICFIQTPGKFFDGEIEKFTKQLTTCPST